QEETAQRDAAHEGPPRHFHTGANQGNHSLGTAILGLGTRDDRTTQTAKGEQWRPRRDRAAHGTGATRIRSDSGSKRMMAISSRAARSSCDSGGAGSVQVATLASEKTIRSMPRSLAVCASKITALTVESSAFCQSSEVNRGIGTTTPLTRFPNVRR